MIGLVLDGVLMLLLVAAVGYGIRLEKKLSALRAGQQAFASAVTELNAAAGRAESALASLRASGQETDLLHDRVMKAREVKAQLETLIAKGGSGISLPRSGEGQSARSDDRVGPSELAADGARLRTPPPGLGSASPSSAGRNASTLDPTRGRESDDDDRTRRMAALAERIQGLAGSVRAPAGRDNVAAIVSAMTANQTAKQSLNLARRNLDADLFAA